MKEKILSILDNDPNNNIEPSEILSSLSFSKREIEEVEEKTKNQWLSKEWYLRKTGMITAFKCLRVFTRQSTLEKDHTQNGGKLALEICMESKGTADPLRQMQSNLNNDYELFYFGDPDTFHVALGRDGAPCGKDDTSVVWLVSILKIVQQVLSSSENFLLFGANCNENCLAVRRFVTQKKSEITH